MGGGEDRASSYGHATHFPIELSDYLQDCPFVMQRLGSTKKCSLFGVVFGLALWVKFVFSFMIELCVSSSQPFEGGFVCFFTVQSVPQLLNVWGHFQSFYQSQWRVKHCNQSFVIT